jgi:phosphatidylglycerophosphate synthase
MNSIISEYKNIRAIQKKPDGVFTTFFSRPISPLIVLFSIKFKISANFISASSFLLCIGSSFFLYYADEKSMFILSGLLWWFGAIFDSADGDLARYTSTTSKFGAWFDSFLDRIKEFIIFGLITFIVIKESFSPLYFLLGILSIFSVVLSGYISDTKKQFVEKRDLALVISKKFAFQMVDTRDFFISLAIFSLQFKYLLILYGTLFPLALALQFYLFAKKYSK